MLPSISTVQGAPNFSINNEQYLNAHLADQENDFQLQLQFAVSESLQSMQQHMHNANNPANQNNDGMDQN